MFCSVVGSLQVRIEGGCDVWKCLEFVGLMLGLRIIQFIVMQCQLAGFTNIGLNGWMSRGLGLYMAKSGPTVQGETKATVRGCVLINRQIFICRILIFY